MTPKRRLRISAAIRYAGGRVKKTCESLDALKEVLAEASCDSEGAVNDCIYDIEHAFERLHGYVLKDMEA